MCPSPDQKPAENGPARTPSRDSRPPQATASEPGTRAPGGEPGGKPASGEPARAKPLLASEALKDDLAPVEPLASAARYWCAAAGVVFIGLGFLPRGMQAGGGAATNMTAHHVLGALALGLSILPLRYAWRAALMVIVALACGVLGVTGRGPSGLLAEVTGEWGLLHLLAAVALPAALLFRARYRAFAGARFVLAAALVLSLPYAVYVALAVVDGGSLLVQLGSGVAVVVLLLSLLGFMGSETTAAGNIMAVCQIIAVAGQLSATALGRLAVGRLPLLTGGALVAVAALAVAAIIGSIGLFQLLAWRLGPEARDVDTLRRPPADRPRQHSVAEWLTRR